MDKKKYNNIDALRTFGCLAIIAWHIKVNASFELGTIAYKIIPSFDYLVYLFMIISGFGMCNGYYRKVHDGNYDMNAFYAKRYKKNLPFFALLIVLNLLIDFNFNNLCEGLMEMTMLFGFLPNNTLGVIGVGWTLGAIFAFYVIFPYFVFLIYNKKRAWMSFLGALLITFMCQAYFMTDKFVVSTFINRHSFLFCLPYFIAGGIIYLYKDKITNFVDRHYLIMLVTCGVVTASYYVVPDEIGIGDIAVLKTLALYSTWLCLALGKDLPLLSNKVTSFISGISMEMYLAHMVVFRIVEKVNLPPILGSGWGGYVATYCVVVTVLILGIKAYQKMQGFVAKQIAVRE